MQVNNYRNNNVSFGSKRIFPAHAKEMYTKKVLPAWFSRLKLSDPVDVAAMREIRSDWDYTTGDKHAQIICDLFRLGMPVYALELESPKSLSRKILCLAAIKRKESNLNLRYIQSSPESSYNTEYIRIYKGAGTAVMRGLVRIAKKAGVSLFKLSATQSSKDFYKKLGMVERNRHMTFNPEEMKQFLTNYR